MFSSILENIDGIKRVCIRKEYNHLPTLTESDTDIIRDLIHLLEPLEKVTTELSGIIFFSYNNYNLSFYFDISIAEKFLSIYFDIP